MSITREDIVRRIDVSDRGKPVAIVFGSSPTRYCLHRGDLFFSEELAVVVESYHHRRAVRFDASDDVFGPRIIRIELAN